MRRLLAVALAVAPACVWAATLEELKQYDLNKNGRIDAGRELDTYLVHLANPQMAKYDKDFDGKLSPAELAKFKQDMEKLPVDDAKFLTQAAYLQFEEQSKKGIPLEQLAVNKAAPSANPCASGQGLYIRRDRPDISVYNRSVDKSAAKGASLSFTDDHLTGSQVAEIHGVASYVIARDPCAPRPADVGVTEPFLSGYALAAWTSADGKLMSDRAKEKSAWKVGLDAQAEIFSGGLFNAQYLTLSPYYQTDFRGMANAYGGLATWEPFLLSWRLGGSYQRFSPWLDFFWKVTGEADALRVDDPGLTALKAGTDYIWLGGTARIYAFLLPELLKDKLTFTGTYKHYWDARSGEEIRFINPALAYTIAPDGSTSVSVEYQKGTDKSTLTAVDQYIVSLNYKF